MIKNLLAVNKFERIQISSSADLGMRLDHFLRNNLNNYTRSQIQLLIRSGNILVNEKNCKTGYALELNDQIIINYPEEEIESSILNPEPMILDILYEDDDMAVINKPSGLVVHPGKSNMSKTLANGDLYHFGHLSTINGLKRPGIVHRLDKDTSGIILIAKNNNAHQFISDQFKNREVKKEYYALTWGIWKEKEGEINASLQRDKKDPTRFCVLKNGKESITKFKVYKEFQHCSLVKFFPKTGRTHQIRVHSSNLGHPIFGDEKYGGGLSKSKGFINEYSNIYHSLIIKLNRHILHAKKIELLHPKNNLVVNFEAPLPKEFINLIKKLENLIDY